MLTPAELTQPEIWLHKEYFNDNRPSREGQRKMTDTMGFFKLFKWFFEQIYIFIRWIFPVYDGVVPRVCFIAFLLIFSNFYALSFLIGFSDYLQIILISLLILFVASVIILDYFVRIDYYKDLDEQVPQRKKGAILFVFSWVVISIGLWAFVPKSL